MLVAEAEVEEVLVVALHAFDGGVDEVEVGAAEVERGVADAVDGELAGGLVADDAALAYVFFAGFELGFDEDDGASLPRGFAFGEGVQDCGQDEGGGDKGDVHGEEGDGRGAQELTGREEAGVGVFEEGDSGVRAELFGELALAGVDAEDGGAAGLEHAVSEAACRSAYIQTSQSGDVVVPVGVGALELEAAAADEFEVGAEEAEGGGGGAGRAGLVDPLLVDEDAAGEDEGLGALAGGGVALVYEELVEAGF